MIDEVTDPATIRAVLGDAHLAHLVDHPEPRPGWRYFGDAQGLICFAPAGSGIWEAHMMMLRSGASQALRDAMAIMAGEGAVEFFGAIPEGNERAIRPAIRAGFRYLARENGFHIMRCHYG